MSKKEKYYDNYDDIELPAKKTAKRKKKKKRKKRLIRTIIVIIIEIILLILIGFFIFIKGKLGQISRYELDSNNLNVTDLGLKDYYNIAIFGVDARDDELEHNTRSDTIMLVSIDTKSGEIKLTSFYRDTYVYIEGHDYTKLGHAYSYGGPELAISTLNDNFDLDITNFVTVNFTAVADAIDLLGGVEIDVKEKEIDSLNKYGREVAKVAGREYTSVTAAGMQTLDGFQAVGYSRIRKIDSDFVRTSRQRDVVDAMFSKVKASDLSTINSIFDKLSPEILTSLSDKEILSLIKNIASYNITESDGFPYNTTTKTLSKISYVLPTDLYEDVKELHLNIFGIQNYTPTSDVENYSSYIKGKIG